MRRSSHLAGLLIYMMLCIFFVSANEKNDLLPNLRFSMAPREVGGCGAVAIMGELGQQNLRGSATYGLYLTPFQRFKITAEGLTQDLGYHFRGKNQREWVSQYAVGGEYQYLIPDCWFQRIDLGGAYSHAFSRDPRSKPFNSTQTIKRRIAGSNGSYGFISSTFELWCGAQLSASGNYDHVKFDRRFESNKELKGFGGSVKLVQQIACDFAITLQADIRRAYNFYEATLTWKHFLSDWGINYGIYGNYTEGKKGVRDVTAAGFQVNFFWDDRSNRCCIVNNACCHTPTACDPTSWVSTPAVYIPVVLAIRDQQINNICIPPTSTTIPDQTIFIGQAVSIDVSVFFTGANLTFSATGLPPGLSIDSITGIISGTNNAQGGDFLVTVTATSPCGSTSQTFTISVGEG